MQQDKGVSKSHHLNTQDSYSRSHKSVIHNANIKSAFPRADLE
jgi:hypothetical protein